jgi:Arc/MetJ family transcription regulator
MRMSITVEKELVERAMSVLGASTKTEAIRLALEEAIRHARLEQVLARAGKVEFAGDVEELLRLRSES